MSPEQSALYTSAQMAHAAGRVEEALHYFLHAARLNQPGEVHCYDMVGHCYAALSRGSEAVAAYKTYVGVDTENPAVWSNLAAFSFNSGDYSYAAHCIAESIRLAGPSVERLLLQFVAHFHAGEDEQAGDQISEYLDKYSDKYENIVKLIEYINSHPSLERREEGLLILRQRGKHILSIILYVSNYFLAKNRPADAISILDQYLKSKVRILQSEVEQSYLSLAQIYLLANDAPAAIVRLQRAMERLRLMKYAARAMFMLGWAHARNGEPELASDCYRAAAAEMPNATFTIMRPSFMS